MAQNHIFMESQVLWSKVTAVLKDGWGWRDEGND